MPRAPVLRVVGVMGALHLVHTSAALACSCDTGTSRAAEDYDMVFLGEALKGGPKGCALGDDAGGTLFEVKEAFVGVEEGREVWIDHDEDQSMCGIALEPGDSYLVYATGGATGGCLPGGRPHQVGDLLRELRAGTY